MPKDLYLDPITHDIVVDNYDLRTTGSLEEWIVQDIKQRLLLFLNEWFLDLGNGTPWIEQILVKGAKQVIVESILKMRIAGTYGVSRITLFSFTEGSGERTVLVQFEAVTINGTNVNGTVEVPF